MPEAPIIDSFMHGPWIGDDTGDGSRADRVAWHGDRRLARAFPDLTIIAHHIGDPWTDTTVRLAARHENFYICTSAWSPKAYPPALMSFLAGRWHGVRGCDKVVFASDFPLMDLERVTRDARRLVLGEEALERFLYGNAKDLFWS